MPHCAASAQAPAIDLATDPAFVLVVGRIEVTRWTTVNLSISFLRMATEATGPLRCEGTAVHEGQRIVVVDAVVTGPDGEAIASGRGTCMTLAARARSGFLRARR